MCSYFTRVYGSEEGKARLKAEIKFIEDRAKSVDPAWLPSAPDVVVKLPPGTGEEVVELCVTPLMLGFTPEHAVRGKSKMVCILDTIGNFLARSYQSVKEPLDIIYAPEAMAGQQVDDFSMVHSIGFSKSLACKAILNAVYHIGLSDDDFRHILPRIKALLRMKAIYDPGCDGEDQLNKSLAGKMRMSERPRPDPLQMYHVFLCAAKRAGLEYLKAIGPNIKAHNSKEVQAGSQISSNEEQFLKNVHGQNSKFRAIVDYHWQNFKIAESALPLTVISSKNLDLDRMPCVRDLGNELWREVKRPTPAKNEAWVRRKIGIFLKNIKNVMRQRNKVNLRVTSARPPNQ